MSKLVRILIRKFLSFSLIYTLFVCSPVLFYVITLSLYSVRFLSPLKVISYGSINKTLAKNPSTYRMVGTRLFIYTSLLSFNVKSYFDMCVCQPYPLVIWSYDRLSSRNGGEDNTWVYPECIRVSLRLVGQLSTSVYEVSYHCVEKESSHISKWPKKWYNNRLASHPNHIPPLCPSQRLSHPQTSSQDLSYACVPDLRFHKPTNLSLSGDALFFVNFLFFSKSISFVNTIYYVDMPS